MSCRANNLVFLSKSGIIKRISWAFVAEYCRDYFSGAKWPKDLGGHNVVSKEPVSWNFWDYVGDYLSGNKWR